MSDNYEMTGAPTSRARPPALYAHDESRQHAALIMHYNTSVSSLYNNISHRLSGCMFQLRQVNGHIPQID